MTISDEELARLQREASERAAENWDPNEARLLKGPPRRATVRRETETEDQMLVRLQQEATLRAQSNWDPNEAGDLDWPNHHIATVVADGLEALIETGPNKGPHLGPAYLTDYLRSPHWRALRDRMLKRAGGYCQRCREPNKRLEVHHLTYRNLGRERESELEVLCHECHEIAHGRTW